jgi:hypothetical protein
MFVIALISLLPLLTSARNAAEYQRWTIECDPAAIDEAEADCGYPKDTIDGGCSTDPPAALPVQCGDKVCGTSMWWSLHYDDDVYELQASQPTVVTFTVNCEFYPNVWLLDAGPGCGDMVVLAHSTGTPAQPLSVTAAVDPGVYWLLLRPLTTYYFECGAKYQLDVSCETVVYGACCLPDGTCASLPSVTCASENGTYRGDETACAEIVCPNGPGACCAADGTCTDGVPQAGCEASAGVYYGGGSLCADIACVYPELPFTRECEPICYDGYVDDFNGGCDPPVTDPIHDYVNCPSRFVGYSGTYLGLDGSPRRDMDLFLENTIPTTTHTLYHWRVTPTFPAQIGFAFVTAGWGDMCAWEFEAAATAQAYHTAIVDIGFTLGSDCWWFFYVRPQAGADVPAGAPYIAELTSEPLEDPTCAFELRGDANCDNELNGYDIDAFVVALAQGEAAWTEAYSVEMPYPALHPCGYLCVNDCNGDGAVNGYDIDPFVRILAGY